MEKSVQFSKALRTSQYTFTRNDENYEQTRHENDLKINSPISFSV